MARTADLTSGHDDAFRAVTGHNLGISQGVLSRRREASTSPLPATAARIPSSATGCRCGAGCWCRRATPSAGTRGAGPRAGPGRNGTRRFRARSSRTSLRTPAFAARRPGAATRCPRHVVAIEAGDAPAGRLVESAEALLADPEGDLAVCIEAPGDPDARCALEEALGPDPRVCVSAAGAALDAFPVSPFHIALPAGAGPAPGLVRGLRSALGDAATATAVLGDGAQVSVARAWALHRARRAGGSAADYGEARRIPAARLALGRALPVARRAGGARSPRGVRAVAARVWGGGAARAGVSHRLAVRAVARRGASLVAAPGRGRSGGAGVGGGAARAGVSHRLAVRAVARRGASLVAAPGPGRRGGAGVGGGAARAGVFAPAGGSRGGSPPGLRWWLRRDGDAAAAPAAAATRTGAQADPPLGAEIAVLGARARAVFAASSRVARELDGRHVDVVLADTPAHAAGIAAPGIATAGIEAPAVILCEAPALAAPALDPALDNPIGWVREVEPRVAVLGPPRLLPPGVRAHRVVRAEDRDALRHCHHLEDVAAFHAGTAERAGTLARLAARGVPVHLADRGPALPALLGAELHGFMTEDIRRRRRRGRARRSASPHGGRRLRAHSLRARARQVCAAALADPPELARISVLLATPPPGASGGGARQCRPAALSTARAGAGAARARILHRRRWNAPSPASRIRWRCCASTGAGPSARC